MDIIYYEDCRWMLILWCHALDPITIQLRIYQLKLAGTKTISRACQTWLLASLPGMVETSAVAAIAAVAAVAAVPDMAGTIDIWH